MIRVVLFRLDIVLYAFGNDRGIRQTIILHYVDLAAVVSNFSNPFSTFMVSVICRSLCTCLFTTLGCAVKYVVLAHLEYCSIRHVARSLQRMGHDTLSGAGG